MAGALLRSSVCLPSSRLSPPQHRSPSTSFAVHGDCVAPKPSRHRHPLAKAWIDGVSRHPRFRSVEVHSAAAEKEGPNWWEKTAGENMVDIHSTEEFLDILSQAGDKLVIVEFFGTWCASCRALFPRLCRTAQENPDIIFVKVNFDENKPMCRRLDVKVLPCFHFYRGADGLLDAFSCSLAKFQKIKDAIGVHNTARCSIGPPAGVGDLDLVVDGPSPQKD